MAPPQPRQALPSGIEAGRLIIRSADLGHRHGTTAVGGQHERGRPHRRRHFELPADAVELLRQVRPADQQRFIEEVTQALAAAAETKDFPPLQDVLQAWTATVRLQRQPGYEAMIQRMQRRERGGPVDLDELLDGTTVLGDDLRIGCRCKGKPADRVSSHRPATMRLLGFHSTRWRDTN